MIELIAPAEWIFSGLCLFACVNHLYRATQGHKSASHLSLSGMALAGFAYGAVTVSSFHAHSLPDWIRATELQYVVATVAYSLFALYAAQCAEIRDRRSLYGVFAFQALAVILSMTPRWGLLASNINGLVDVALPWGETVPVPTGGIPLPRLLFYALPAYVSFAYVFSGCVRLKKRGERFAARALTVGALIALAGVAVNDLNAVLALSPVMFPEFGFLAMIVIMGLNLSTNLMEGHHFAFVGDSTAIVRVEFDEPISISLPPDEQIRMILRSGYVAECNEAFARLRGSTRREIIGRRMIELTVASDPRNQEVFQAIAAANYRARDVETHGRDVAGNDRYYCTSVHGVVDDGRLVRFWLSQYEITDQKRAEASAMESSDRFARLCEASFEGIGISENGVLIDANEQLAHMLGYELAELIGRPTADLVAPQSKELVRENMRAGHEGVYEHEAIRKDGSVFSVEVQARMMKQGERWVRVSAVRDTTGRIQAQRVLAESEERYRQLVNHASDIIYSTDATGHLSFFNPVACRILGYSSEELAGMHYLEVIRPDLREAAQRFYRTQSRDQTPSTYYEFPMVLKDGGVVWVGQNVRLEIRDGQVAGFHAVARDITERKQAEDAMKTIARGVYGTTGDAFFRTLVEHLALVLKADLVCVAVRDGEDPLKLRTIAVWADGRPSENFAYELAGTPCEEVTAGRLCTFPSGVSEQFPKDRMLSDLNIEGYAGIPLMDDAGSPVGLIAVLYRSSITNPRLAESALQIAASRAAAELGWKKAEAKILELNLDLERRVEQRTEELRAVNRELEAFSYSVSHDLRAPLRNISGFADLLKNNAGGLSAEGAGYLATIAREVRRMGALIDDLLEFSHISRTEMFMTTFDPAELVKEVRELLEIETGNRQISWHVEPLPQVKADRGLLRQVFANLMGNSIKYTGPRESATIHIGTLAEQPGAKDRVFFVRDNGVGFDMKYADKLFGVFQRLHSAKQFEGTGIGLANVQRIINRHGGSVWADGSVNVGSTFYFSLPGPASNGSEK